MECFNNFVQSAVNSRREGDKNPNSSVVAGTMKLLASSSHDYQNMDRSQHTVTKYLVNENTHEGIKNKIFRRLGNIKDQLVRVDVFMSQLEHKTINNCWIFFAICKTVNARAEL